MLTLKKIIKPLSYYIPLVPRPKVLVTTEMLDKITSIDTDKPVIIQYKNKLYERLIMNLGEEIVEYSPHFYFGLLSRFIFYLGFIFYTDLEVFMFILVIYVIYSGIFVTWHDNFELHKKYLSLNNILK